MAVGHDISGFWSQTGTQECAVLLVMQADVHRKSYLPTCDIVLGSTLHAHFTTAAHDHVHGIAHSILPGDCVACFEVRLACGKSLNHVVMFLLKLQMQLEEQLSGNSQTTTMTAA